MGAIPEALCGEAPKGQSVSVEKTSWRSEGRPERSADDPQTPKNTAQREANEANGGDGEKKAKWSVIVTVDEDGHERKWGPLSRNAAWRAGRFWEGRRGTVKVLLEKGETRGRRLTLKSVSMKDLRPSGFSTKSLSPKKPKK